MNSEKFEVGDLIEVTDTHKNLYTVFRYEIFVVTNTNSTKQRPDWAIKSIDARSLTSNSTYTFLEYEINKIF